MIRLLCTLPLTALLLLLTAVLPTSAAVADPCYHQGTQGYACTTWVATIHGHAYSGVIEDRTSAKLSGENAAYAVREARIEAMYAYCFEVLGVMRTGIYDGRDVEAACADLVSPDEVAVKLVQRH